MLTKLGRLAACVLLAAAVCAAQNPLHFIHGTIKKVDSATKTVVIKTADGTEHTVKFTGDTTVKGTKDGFDGLKEGTEVVARTTGQGVDETAVDVGKVSKDGLKSTKGTVEKFYKDTKTVVVKTARWHRKDFPKSPVKRAWKTLAKTSASQKARKSPCITQKRAARKPRTTSRTSESLRARENAPAFSIRNRRAEPGLV